ncbi:hypothetical protein ACMFMF_007740 [Clarireedia jacksonii]
MSSNDPSAMDISPIEPTAENPCQAPHPTENNHVGDPLIRIDSNKANKVMSTEQHHLLLEYGNEHERKVKENKGKRSGKEALNSSSRLELKLGKDRAPARRRHRCRIEKLRWVAYRAGKAMEVTYKHELTFGNNDAALPSEAVKQLVRTLTLVGGPGDSTHHRHEHQVSPVIFVVLRRLVENTPATLPSSGVAPRPKNVVEVGDHGDGLMKDELGRMLRCLI